MFDITDEIEKNAFYSIVNSVADITGINYGLVEEVVNELWTQEELFGFLVNPALMIYEWIPYVKQFIL